MMKRKADDRVFQFSEKSSEDSHDHTGSESETVKNHSFYEKIRSVFESLTGRFQKKPDEKQGYEAFISYRHLDLDTYAAVSLHRLLERYTIPKSVRKDRSQKHIHHIFRDRDELPISADLSASIQNALRSSSWLIVICTPQTQESEWVAREIDAFLQTHPRERIILVLADGEPEEAFPKKLLQIPDPDDPDRITEVEPLAADVRGKTKRERLKKMKEEKLRIMSALLQVPYDALVRRDRDYRVRRTVVLSLTVSLFLLTFGLVTAHQNSRIKALNDETSRALAEETAESAMSLYQKGDRKAALEHLLSASDENGQLLSPSQLFPLSEMLQTFRTGAVIEYAPVDSYEAADDAFGLNVSKSGKTALWNEPDGFVFYDLENRKPIRKVEFTELYSGFDHKNIPEEGLGSLLIDDQSALLWAAGALFNISITDGEVTHRIAVNGKSSSKNPILQADLTDGKLTVAGRRFLKQYDLNQDLKEVFSADFNNIVLSKKFSMAVDSSAGRIALGSSLLSDWNQDDADSTPGLYMIDTAGSDQAGPEKLSDEHITQVLFADDDHLLALSPDFSENSPDQFAIVSSGQMRLTTWEQGQKAHSSGPWRLTDGQMDDAMRILSHNGKKQLALCSDFHVFLLDPVSHEISWQGNFSDEVNGIYPFDSESRFLVRTGFADISSVAPDTGSRDSNGYFPLIRQDAYGTEHPQIIYNDKQEAPIIVTLSNTETDSSFGSASMHLVTYRPCSMPEQGVFAFTGLMDLQFSDSESSRPVILAIQGEGTETTEIRFGDLPTEYRAVLFDEQTQEKLLSVSCPVDTEGLRSSGLKASDTENSFSRPRKGFYPGVQLVESEGVCEIVWTDGKMVFRQGENEKSLHQSSIDLKDPLCTVISPDGEWVGIDDEDGFHLYEWSSQTERYELTRTLPLEDRTFGAQWSADGEFLVIQGKDWTRVWNMKKNDWVFLEDSQEGKLYADNYPSYPLQIDQTSGGFRLGKEKPLLLVNSSGSHGSDRTLAVYDLKTGKIIHELDDELLNSSFDGVFSFNSADFSDRDQVLVLAMPQSSGRGSQLIRYSLRNRNILSAQDLPQSVQQHLISKNVLATGESVDFALTDSGAYLVSRQKGYQSGTDALYTADEAGVYLSGLLDSERVYYSSDLKKMAQCFDGGFIVQKWLSSEELAAQARELLKETQTEDSADPEEPDEADR